jgi:hypothetical protein
LKPISVTQGKPYLSLKPNADELTGNDRYEGYCVELAYKVMTRLNLDYEIRLVADGKFGVRDSNGSWNGMVGELVRRVSTVTKRRLYNLSQ